MSASSNVFTGSFAGVYDRHLVPMNFGAPRTEDRRACGCASVSEYAGDGGRYRRCDPRTGAHPAIRANITATELNQPIACSRSSNVSSERIRWQ
jgi:hypothetical protein